MRSTTTTGLKRQLKNGWQSTISNFKNDFVCSLCAYDTFDISIPPARWMEVCVCVQTNLCPSILKVIQSIDCSWLWFIWFDFLSRKLIVDCCYWGGPFKPATERHTFYRMTNALILKHSNCFSAHSKAIISKSRRLRWRFKIWTSNVNRRWPFCCVFYFKIGTFSNRIESNWMYSVGWFDWGERGDDGGCKQLEIWHYDDGWWAVADSAGWQMPNYTMQERNGETQTQNGINQ